MKSFAELFKRYRLRAEFETFSSFAEALGEKGFYYEESIFSHWQKGTRTPTNRELLLSLITLFKERNSMTTMGEANEFLASVGLGYLTDAEREKLDLETSATAPFQVPNEIANFTGREKLIEQIEKQIINGKIILLHGAPGIGKTAVAIKLGHALQAKFPDGVLWYKVDSSNTMDIFLSIAHLFGEDIHEIKDIEVRASVVRTLLAKKKILLVFDNVAANDCLHLLLPNTANCGVIFTSRDSTLPIANEYETFSLHLFTKEEVLALFQKVFNKKYAVENKKTILQLAEKLGNLPLAVNIAATHLKQFSLSPTEYIKQLNNSVDLHTFKYEDKTLLQAVTLGFTSLDSLSQAVFISLGVFEGKDFSLEAVAFINKLSVKKTELILHQLLALSFIERSKIGRYRIHPLLKLFAREKLTDSTIYLRASAYFEKLLVVAEESHSYKNLTQDVDNIIYIFKKCYDYGYWDQLITLWNPVEKLLSDTNELKKLRSLMETIDTSPNINLLQKILTGYFIFLIIFWIILNIYIHQQSLWGHIISLFYSFIPFSGGLVGVLRSSSWGFAKSNIAKAIFFISAGSLSWSIGNIVWAYYNLILQIELPYPSWADLGFAPTYPLWLIGTIFLSKATGTKFELSKRRNKLFLLVIPLVITALSYYFLFFIVKRSFEAETFLRLFFDMYYPTMDIIILTLATIIFGISVNFFGGKYKLSLFSILLGYIFLYSADFTFSYLTSTNQFYTGGFDDMLFMLGFYFISWGTLSFYLTPKRQS